MVFKFNGQIVILVAISETIGRHFLLAPAPNKYVTFSII